MVGVVGYVLKTSVNDNFILDYMLDECKPAYIESDIVKIVLAPSMSFGIVVPKNRALYDYAYDIKNSKATIIYGYIIDEDKKITAKEVMNMNNSELAKLLEKVDGSFSIVKIENGKLYIVTDWIGSRPLYYYINGKGIVFSSCLWSILRFFKETGYSIKFDDKAILSFLWLGRIGVLDNLTLVEGVHVVPPGNIFTLDLKSGKHCFYKYYGLHYETKITDKKHAVALTHNALLKSTRETLKALPDEMKGDLCVLLSGGLDSRVLIYYLSRYLNSQIRNLRALTFGTRKCDEIPIANKVAKELGILHITEKFDPDQLAEYAYETIRLSDGFCPISAAHVVYISKILLKNNCRIFTDGFLLDVALGGRFIDRSLRSIRSESEFCSHILRKISIFDHKELISVVGSRLRHQLPEVLQEIKNLISSSVGDNYMNKNDCFFIYSRSRRFIIYGSVVARQSSEEILPTISRKFAEVFTKIDPHLRASFKVYRRFLLRLNKRLSLIPYKLTWIPPLIPERLWKAGYALQKLNNLIRKLTKDRLGLETTYFDFSEALKYKKWRRLLYETVFNRESLIYKLGYLNYDLVKNMGNEHLRGNKIMEKN
jgi:asparagine synthetase B (glutamine-hydrolysing)